MPLAACPSKCRQGLSTGRIHLHSQRRPASSRRKRDMLRSTGAISASIRQTLLAQGVRLSGKKLNDPTEQIKVVRVPVQEVTRLAANGTITNAMQIASLAIALSTIGKWSL